MIAHRRNSGLIRSAHHVSGFGINVNMRCLIKLHVIGIFVILASCNTFKKQQLISPYVTDAITEQKLKDDNPEANSKKLTITALTSDREELWYYEQYFSHIAGSKSGRSPVYGNVRLLFSIGLQGNLISVKLLKSSGNHELDQHALSLVRQSSPFPQPPKSIALRSSVVHLIQTFSFSP